MPINIVEKKKWQLEKRTKAPERRAGAIVWGLIVMDISTFSLFESARRGLNSNQVALNIVSQNVSNSATPGYTRQEAMMKSTAVYGNPIGTGVDVTEIRQVRDRFIETQLRTQNQIATYQSTRENYLERVQSLFADSSDSGIRSLMDNFWKSAEDVANYPQSEAIRSVMIQSATSLAASVRYFENQSDTVQDSIDSTIDEKVAKVNELAKKIATINFEISKNETGDPLSRQNDLRDERMRLITELSKLVAVTVTDTPRIDDGQILVNGRVLVNDVTANELEATRDETGYVTVRWKDDIRKFSSNENVLNGKFSASAVEGNYGVDVKSVASGFSIASNQANLDKNDLLMKLPGATGGTVTINGRQINVDVTKTTVSGLVELINSNEMGVTASLGVDGRIKLVSKRTGIDSRISLADGTSNLFESLGMVSSVTGKPQPTIRDENASLNIAGSFTINGIRITITQGQTDSLSRIVREINAMVPGVKAETLKDGEGFYKIRLASKDGFSKVTLKDESDNLLYRLGLITAPSVDAITIPGALTASGRDAEFSINNVDYRRSSNNVTDVLNGVEINLLSPGKARLDIRHAVKGGEIGALLEVRDETIPKIVGDFSVLVKKFVDEFNNVHSTGFDLAGDQGKTFFTPINETDPKKILLAFGVSDEIADNPQKIAAATYDEIYFSQTGILRTKGVGDNTTMLRMVEIKTKAVFSDGSKITEKYAQIVSTVGTLVSNAKSSSGIQQTVLQNLENKKESISGVSMDEEMANMLKYQSAYNASAKMIGVIDTMINTIINIVGR